MILKRSVLKANATSTFYTKMSRKITCNGKATKKEYTTTEAAQNTFGYEGKVNVIVIPDVTDNEIDPHHQY